eukprot:TRINITY_DN23251_c0_g1_i2.p1 TRINITY_DN23251_c0_g1~~TRINITY_DN23251_c0_g1_i2.p1  ORF type:complete len:289 (-),score=47.09 TRINITY_DN23251_c0_g1_i2:113-979(-)
MSLTAFNGSKAELSYRNVSVCDEPLFKEPLSTLLCTQTFLNPTNLKLAYSWAMYHLRHLRFDHVLVYVEHPDMTPFAENLSEFIEEGRLTLIDAFVEGLSGVGWSQTVREVSEHYIFRAKGHVKWIANNDIDEYYDVKGAGNISRALDRIETKHGSVNVVNVKRQLWRIRPEHNVTLEGYPCTASCKLNDGYENSFKPIFKAEHINYHIIHFVTDLALVNKSQRKIIVLPEVDDIRINHLQFRHLHLNQYCSNDYSWNRGWESGLYAQYLQHVCTPGLLPKIPAKSVL